MKKTKSLRKGLMTGAVLVAVIPVIIFAVVSQLVMQRELRTSLEDAAKANIENADQCLNLLLDKYATILMDFCTEDEVLEIVEEINQNQNILDVNTSILRRKLSHICNRNTGIEGMTMVLKNGQTIFYDGSNSSINSEWAQEVTIPQVNRGEVYQSLAEPILLDGEETYIFQIARNLVDYRDIHKELGTVVISINENLISDALKEDSSANVYLLDKNVIISAMDNSMIGRHFGKIENIVTKFYSKKTNETCGFTICVEKDLSRYNRATNRQIFVLFVVTLVTMWIMVFLTYKYTKPYMRTVYSFESAMYQVEKGNFTIQVKLPENMPDELVNIEGGFNEMVAHLGEMIEKVKLASLEQRNAELSALEAQIDPHFLYNTLDAINWKAIENDQYEISEMLVALAEILRYTVKNAGGTTTLNQEIEWLKKYTRLQSVKLGKIPDVEIKISEEMGQYRIHKLLLQPFVENSIKYGFAEKENDCVLQISARRIENQLHLMLEDNGCGMSVEKLACLNNEEFEPEGHLGVANVRKRLKLYYGEEAAVYFESEEGSYTRVHLFIPLREENI